MASSLEGLNGNVDECGRRRRGVVWAYCPTSLLNLDHWHHHLARRSNVRFQLRVDDSSFELVLNWDGTLPSRTKHVVIRRNCCLIASIDKLTLSISIHPYLPAYSCSSALILIRKHTHIHAYPLRIFLPSPHFASPLHLSSR